MRAASRPYVTYWRRKFLLSGEAEVPSAGLASFTAKEVYQRPLPWSVLFPLAAMRAASRPYVTYWRRKFLLSGEAEVPSAGLASFTAKEVYQRQLPGSVLSRLGGMRYASRPYV